MNTTQKHTLSRGNRKFKTIGITVESWRKLQRLRKATRHNVCVTVDLALDAYASALTAKS